LLATAGLTFADTLPANAVAFPPSTTCDGGTQIIDNTVEGVHTKLYTLRSGGETDICIRIDDALNGTGAGGDLVINPTALPGVTVGTISLPFTDTFPGGCAAGGNQLPGTHPISSGGVDGIPYLIDAYVSGTQVSLCFGAASVNERLVVPISVPTVTVSPGSLVVFYPDPGTP
jgi:hypothetical protein